MNRNHDRFPGQIEVSNLDHLGLVAGMIDEIGIVKAINELVGEQPGEKLSPGQAVKAMILNGLGLVSSPLYLFSRFFEGKATEHLIGEGIKASHLNDDRLGRVLDKLYLRGLTEIFTNIALASAKKFEVSLEVAHLDSSSFHVHGEYDINLPEVKRDQKENHYKENQKTDSYLSPHPVNITYGYSRDHRPDLKQFLLNLICSEDGDVPLHLKVGDGNESDKKVFPQIFTEFRKQLNLEALMVADSALYSQENLLAMSSLKWLSRVPFSVKQAKQLVTQLDSKNFTQSSLEGYHWSVHFHQSGGIQQRWLVVESQMRREADLRRLDKKIEKDYTASLKKTRELSRSNFACVPDAIQVAQKVAKTFKYYLLEKVETQEIPPKKTDEQSLPCYRVTISIQPNQLVIDQEKRLAGRFILATNVLDESQLSPNEMLIKYKNQQSTERGFAFLKDPLFFTDSVFLKSPERVEAIALIMGLCLLVYTLAQRQLRQQLKRTQSCLKNQLGKATNQPTLRWIFQCFQSVHCLELQGHLQISNLTEERLRILQFFPLSCQRYYLLT